MKSCEYDGVLPGEPRSHPWSDSAANTSHRYHDLTAHPGLIRTSLEDLLPWSHYRGITHLYELLERMNVPGSLLESNDCGFSAPDANDAPHVDKALQCQGRVMVLYRELEWNLSRRRVHELAHAIHVHLATHDRDFEWGIVGTTIAPTRYVNLPGAHDEQLGHQLMLSFWAWGDSEAEVMGNLDRVIVNLAGAVAEAVRQTTSS